MSKESEVREMVKVEQALLDELKRLRDIADRHKDDTEIGQLLAITDRVVAVAEEIRKINT